MNNLYKFNSQLFGKACPPLYCTETAVEIIEKISAVDEKINELAIERESYVKALKKELKKSDTTED